MNQYLESIIKPSRKNLENFEKNFFQYVDQFEKIHFSVLTHDDVELNCIFYHHKNFLTETVIYVHSYSSCKEEGMHLLQSCAENRMNLIIFDQRSCGKSSESYIHFGFKENIDIFYILLKSHLKYQLNKFILWGRSMGCNSILQLVSKLQNKEKQSRRKLFGNITNQGCSNEDVFINEFWEKNDCHFQNLQFQISAIVLDAPYQSFSEFMKQFIKKQSKFGSLIHYPITQILNNYFKKTINVDIKDLQNIDLIKEIKINTIFLFSKNDDLVSIDQFQNLKDQWGVNVKEKGSCVEIYHEASHAGTRQQELLAQVIKEIHKFESSQGSIKFSYEQKVEQIPQKFLKCNFNIQKKENQNLSLKNNQLKFIKIVLRF